MKIYIKDKPINNPDDHWKRWFAWYPVKIGNYWVWLEWVERWKEFMGIYTELDYRLPKLNNKLRF